MQKADEHFREGRLAEAISAAIEAVKSKPSDVSSRRFLFELLCFSGDLERADRHLDVAGQLDPKEAVGVSLLRHVLRAEQARRQFFLEGRVPEFLDVPSEEHQLRIKASIALREGKGEEALELLRTAEEQRRPVSGVCNGEPFEDLRDLDDLTASFFEVLTSTGKYYWIPIERVQRLAFEAPVQPNDLLWRRARIEVANGPDGEVFLPVLYAGSHENEDDKIKLGRATDWIGGGETSPVRGVGQRTFLVGDRDLTILELTEIETSAHAESGG
jgi:type VI secretion system protein ImpE